MRPYIIHEALLSPGCTLAVRMMAFLMAISSGILAKLVTMSISTSLPAKLLHNTVFLTLSLFWNVQVLLTNLQTSE